MVAANGPSGSRVKRWTVWWSCMAGAAGAVGNHPRHFFHCLAENRLGASIVPLNPDHRGGALTLRHAQERVLNPLPVFHMNCGMTTIATMCLTDNCLVLPDRFHASTWWEDCVKSGATAGGSRGG